jgi:hypothetical protein
MRIGGENNSIRILFALLAAAAGNAHFYYVGTLLSAH